MTLNLSRYIFFVIILVLSTIILVILSPKTEAGTLPGDANGDYNVSLHDAVAALQIVAGLNPRPLNPGGDASNDGRLGIADAIYIMQVTAGYIPSIPFNLFTVGDSISEAEAADDDLGTPHHESVWSSGYASQYGSDSLSLNERFAARYPEIFQANSSGTLDIIFNHAKSGAVMADFPGQVAGIETVKGVIDAAEQDSEAGKAGLLTIMLGSNDVCTDEVSGPMTDPVLFENYFRAGLEALRNSPVTRNAHINVVGIPAIYWLWEAKRSNFLCRVLIWPQVPCQNLLKDANTMDCDPDILKSHLDPDTIYNGDTGVCLRRKEFHRDVKGYNTILADLVTEYQSNGWLPHIYFTDIYDIQFSSDDVNSGDCFHPSLAGQARLADEAWCQSPWGKNDSFCSP